MLVAQEEFHAPQPGARQRPGHGRRHALRFLQVLGSDPRGLETLAVVAALLHVADRRAEKGGAVPLRHGEQRDFAVEADELLDDQLAYVSPRTLASVTPCVLHVAGAFDDRLPLARGGHQRLDDARIADSVGRIAQLVERPGIEVPCGAQPQLFRCEVADRLAVHREIHRTGARDDLYPGAFEVVKPFGADGLDFRNDDVGAVSLDDGLQRRAVEHVEDFGRIGDLHGGRSRVCVARHDGLSQPLRRNRELLAQLSRAQKQYLFGHGLIRIRFVTERRE